MKCALCGFEFEEQRLRCAKCALGRTCNMLRCPNCGYTTPEGESSLVRFFKKIARRGAARNRAPRR